MTDYRRAQTDHVNACRNAWYKHYDYCPRCHDIGSFLDRFKGCDDGRVLYEEYANSIKANPDCENLEGKDNASI
jgi:hypothetical protein